MLPDLPLIMSGDMPNNRLILYLTMQFQNKFVIAAGYIEHPESTVSKKMKQINQWKKQLHLLPDIFSYKCASKHKYPGIFVLL